MDLSSVNGLPLHALLVHVAVVLVPVTALCVLLAAAWPTARRRLGIVNALLGAVIIVLIPLTKNAGEWLRDRVAPTPLIESHAELGESVVPWALALGLLGIATWLWYFVTETRASAATADPARGIRRAVGVVLVVLAIGIGGIATYQTVLAGESGSRAVWQNNFRDTLDP